MKVKLILVAAIWLAWAVVRFLVEQDKFDEFQIISRTGVPMAGECKHSRYAKFLELSMQYEDRKDLASENILLPTSIQCDKALISKLIGHKVTITNYRNLTIGLAVDEEIIMHVKDYIEWAESNDDFLGFLTVMAVVCSIIVAIRGTGRGIKDY